METPIFSARKKDFRVDTFAAGGPGGQNQNKKQSGVRITHIESGLSAECREERDQLENKKRAFRKLAKLVVAWALAKEQSGKKYNISKETVRTYHEPDNRVKDHKSGFVQPYKDVVKAGNIEKMVDARTRANRG